jgi:hypothetical protein
LRLLRHVRLLSTRPELLSLLSRPLRLSHLLRQLFRCRRRLHSNNSNTLFGRDFADCSYGNVRKCCNNIRYYYSKLITPKFQFLLITIYAEKQILHIKNRLSERN